jgi:uncharacterized protein
MKTTSNLIELTSKHWQLYVWSRDIRQPQAQLAQTLATRGLAMPQQFIQIHPFNDIKCTSLHDIHHHGFSFPSPLFFENRSYEFDFVFNDKVEDAEVFHINKAVQDSFHFTGKSLRGNINFGNDIGWFRLNLRYQSDGKWYEQAISFEVWPSKMDMAGDLSKIHHEIDQTYPLWRFSFAKKTEQSLAQSNKAHEHFPLLWLAQFSKLRTELAQQLRYIIKAPHHRLLATQRAIPMERLRGRLSARLEEQVALALHMQETQRRFKVKSQQLSVNTPENRFIKMVLQRCQRELNQFVQGAHKLNKSLDQDRISAAFFTEIGQWKAPLNHALAQPFFAEVGHFDGQESESLVLHQRAGYSGVYRVWQQLKMYLDVFGQDAAISVKSIAQLYEVWCLLEVRRHLIELGFVEVESSKASLQIKHLEKQLKDQQGAAFCFKRDDGFSLRLAHEPSFSKPKDKPGIYSWNAKQEPDILLEVCFPKGEKITFLFDAKYRIEHDAKTQIDFAPEDAINQMHRYRDALIHLNPHADIVEKTRPIIGAYILYPGYFDQSIDNNPYKDAIEAVGIGAFATLPGQENQWLKTFLQQHLQRETSYRRHTPDEYLAQDSVRIAPSGMHLSRYADLALLAQLGPNRNQIYKDQFALGQALYYHMPVKTTSKRQFSTRAMQEITYCVITGGNYFEYAYPVKSLKKVRRGQLNIEQSGSTNIRDQDEDYWLFELGTAEKLPTAIACPPSAHFQLKLSSALALFAGKNWEQLPERYAFLYPS